MAVILSSMRNRSPNLGKATAIKEKNRQGFFNVNAVKNWLMDDGFSPYSNRSQFVQIYSVTKNRGKKRLS